MFLRSLPITITNHADERLCERFGLSNLDTVRDEIFEAIWHRSFEFRAANIFYVWSLNGLRMYVVAQKRERLVVLTVCDERELLAA